jgi:hypothetical protein
MVELIPAPDPHALLPPLLACLPTAFASSRPPPALLPLLSPILQQRLQLISDPHENWLRLLCWDRAKGEALKEQVENVTFEPHPVSGEIEVGDVSRMGYKRLDEETLRAQMALEEWPFGVVFLWCSGGDGGSGWKLTEMLPEAEWDEAWCATIQEANETSSARIVDEALRDAGKEDGRARPASGSGLLGPVAARSEEDDYWAQYDQTPDGRTPARKHSVQPNLGGPSEDEYYERYGEVQPAMDGHDSDEEMQNGDVGASTLNGGMLTQIQTASTHTDRTATSPPPYQDQDPMEMGGKGGEKDTEVRQPVPTSPSSRGGSDAIARLEDTAERYNASDIGIRQHIGTTMKSLYRLAKSTGMDREEFERLVNRELEGLSIFDRDE